jgi:hypothetical protein
MRTAITLKAWRRPEYFEEVIKNLAPQILNYTNKTKEFIPLILVLDGGYPKEQEEMLQIAKKYLKKTQYTQTEVSLVSNTNLGCTGATKRCFKSAFDILKTDYMIHLEDDTVPGKDFLEYMMTKGKENINREDVFSISAYNRNTIYPDLIPNTNQASLERQKFTCWGWGIWKRIWDEMKEDFFGIVWTKEASTLEASTDIPNGKKFLDYVHKTDAGSWAWPMNKYWRGERVEIYPVISRVQNIGKEKGLFNRGGDWHNSNHHTPIWINNV